MKVIDNLKRINIIRVNNMKIRSKLLLSFIAILIITIIVGLNGLFTAGKIQQSFEEFYSTCFVPNMILSDIQLNQEKQSRNSRESCINQKRWMTQLLLKHLSRS